MPSEELVDLFNMEFKVIPSLIRALRPASLMFRFNVCRILIAGIFMLSLFSNSSFNTEDL